MFVPAMIVLSSVASYFICNKFLEKNEELNGKDVNKKVFDEIKKDIMDAVKDKFNI